MRRRDRATGFPCLFLFAILISAVMSGASIKNVLFEFSSGFQAVAEQLKTVFGFVTLTEHIFIGNIPINKEQLLSGFDISKFSLRNWSQQLGFGLGGEKNRSRIQFNRIFKIIGNSSCRKISTHSRSLILGKGLSGILEYDVNTDLGVGRTRDFQIGRFAENIGF